MQAALVVSDNFDCNLAENGCCSPAHCASRCVAHAFPAMPLLDRPACRLELINVTAFFVQRFQAQSFTSPPVPPPDSAT